MSDARTRKVVLLTFAGGPSAVEDIVYLPLVSLFFFFFFFFFFLGGIFKGETTIDFKK